MLKRILTVVHEQRIDKVICALFVLTALQAIGEAVDAPFLNRVVHSFNALHLSQYWEPEPPGSALIVGGETFRALLYSVLAFVTYRWSCQKGTGGSRG